MLTHEQLKRSPRSKTSKNRDKFTHLIDSAALGKKDSLRILHVDDDLYVLEISKQILTMENNFEVENVTSVDEAFQKMQQQPYDTIVSDYEMPQKNGLDFLKELREQKNDIPFILFTGKGREDVVVKALNLGADSYINKNGSPETVYCELADAINKTVERKRSRKLLVASESKYRMLVEKSLQGILVTKAAPLRLVFANDAMGQILGYSPQELLSLLPEGILGLVHHEDRAVFFKRMENRLRGEKADACFEFRAVRKDGSIIWLSALSNRVDYDGQPAVLGMFLDVSENKKAGEFLAESEARYRELANCLPEIVFETDINGQVVFANEGAPKLSGYSQGELETGLNILQFLVPEDRERAIKSIQRLLAGGSYVPTEYTFVRKDGTTFPSLITATPIISKNKVTGLRGLVIDITERKKTEQEFVDLAKFPSENPNPILRVSKDNLILYGNPASNSLLKGLNVQIGQSPPRFLSQPVAIALKSGLRQEAKCEINQREFLFTITPIKDTSYANVYGLDITERQKAEEALKQNEEKFRTLAEESPNMIFINKRGRVVYANKKCEDITGYTKEEFYSPNFNFLSLCAPEYVEEVKLSYARHMRGESVPPYEYVLITRDGKRNDEIITTKLIDYEGEKAVLGIITDFTERKKKEFELQLERDKLETVTENIGAGLFLVDKDYKILWTNNMSKHHFGELKSKQCYLAFRNLNDVCPDCGVREIFENGKEIDVREHCFKDTKGDPGWLELTVRPIKDGTGKVVAALELAVPITGRKKAEEALADSEARYRALVENADDTILLTDLRGKHIYRNRAYYKSLGYEEGDNIGLDEFSKVHPDDVSIVKEKMSELLKTGSMVSEYRVKNRDGRWLHRFAKSTLIYNAHNQPYAILAIIRDVTEHKKIEDQLRATSLYSRSLLEASLDPLVTISKEGKITDVNKATEDITGCSRELLIGSDFSDYFTEPENARIGYHKVFTEGLVKDYPLGIRHKSGRVSDVLYNAAIYRNANGEIQGVFAAARDITERKKSEEIRKVLENKVKTYSEHLKYMVDLRTAQLQDANERLVKSERLAAIGELAGMVGHDLRNPLAGIKNATYLLKKKGTTISEAQAKETLEIIDKAIDHSNKIINDLLDYSREMNLKLIRNAIRPLVDEAVRMIQVPDRIQIVNHVDEEVCVWVDADKMLRVFVNLLQNAIDAMPEKGRLEITSCQKSNFVEIAFADTGKGIPEEVLPKLFTPLFTTKAQGMGFGLAICKRIIEVQGGTINVESAKDKGTKFTINLPAKIN